MSVRTAADDERDQAIEYLEAAVQHIKVAEKHLEKASDKETWGSEEWTKEYRRDLRKMGDRCKAFRRKIDDFTG